MYTLKTKSTAYNKLTVLTKNNNLREVIAFPKAASAKCLMSNAPTPVAETQLNELKIKITE